MILFCGISSEPPLALAIDAAQRRGIDHVVFHQRDAQFSDIALDHQGGRIGGYLWAQQREWNLEKFTGVYTRLIESDTLPEHRRGLQQSDALGIARSAFLHQVLETWIELTECRVANKASAMSSNVSKPYQTQSIARFFSIPPTLVTNQPDEVRQFVRLHGDVIYKSISSVRSIVQKWSAADEKNIDRIRKLPTQFQRCIPGTDIRVHVVGSRVFAVEIQSDAVDYRYAGRDGVDIEMRPVELPAEIHRKCRELALMVRLPFCGIDLRRTEQGEYYCFEVNPSPAYSYYQEMTGQPIADALVDYLAGITE